MTAIDATAKHYLEQLWGQLDLPPVAFDGWTLEFAREVYEIATIYREESRDDLLSALMANDVFEDDAALHQWKPPGSKWEF